MGFLSRFFKSSHPGLIQLPAGSFTLDREGMIMTSTLPQTFPAEHMRSIGNCVLSAFRLAKKAQMPLSEIIIQYAALKVLARELRGGAIIFLMPQSLSPRLKKH
jgi:hypothetical protein